MTNEPTEPTITYGHYSDSGVRNYGQDAWSFLNPDHPTTKVEEIRYHAVDCQCDGCKALDEFYLDQL